MVHNGIATETQVDIDTLDTRLRSAAAEVDAGVGPRQEEPTEAEPSAA